MTQPDLSSLALPDSPELPAEIEEALQIALGAVRLHEHPEKCASLRRVIAKHLLTAEEARELFLGMAYLPHPKYEAWVRGREKLRVIAGLPSPHPVPPHMPGRGSSRGEE